MSLVRVQVGEPSRSLRVSQAFFSFVALAMRKLGGVRLPRRASSSRSFAGDDPSPADKRRCRPEAYCKFAFEETIMQVRGTEELKRVRVAIRKVLDAARSDSESLVVEM